MEYAKDDEKIENDFNIWERESGHAKVLRKFNTPKSQGGYRCDGFEEYPKMLYRANRHPLSGKYYVALEEDELTLDRTRVMVDAQQFNRSCQLEVSGPDMEEKCLRAGWRKSPAEALAYHESEIERLATEAAHRNYDDRNMSEKAQKEIQEAEDATPAHVAEVKEKRRAAMAKARAAKALKKANPDQAA